eukprot:jgi/Bigna1/127357/aug1.4_g2065
MSQVTRMFKEKVQDIGTTFLAKYKEVHKDKKEVILIDMFLLFSFLTGVVQFIYLIIAGQFPYNSFCAGFFSALGVFVSTACLRMQVVAPEDFDNIPKERAFADFVVFNVLLHFVPLTMLL